MKIHSKYFNKDFDVNGEDIRHEDLENIIINELTVPYKFKVEEVDDHPVVICSMEKNERYVQAIGEAKEDEEYPTVIASERAFDKAALLYLNAEVPISENLDYPVDTQDKEVKVVSAPITVTEEPETVETPVKSEVTVNPVSEDSSENLPEPQTSPEAQSEPEPQPEPQPEVISDPIITIGKYKDKKIKASEVVATDKSWAEFIVNKMNNVNGPLLEQINAMRNFLSKE